MQLNNWKAISGVIVPAVVLFIAVYYYYYFNKHSSGINETKHGLDEILSGLLRAEKKVDNLARPRVALGLGGCLDLTVSALALFQKLGLAPSNNSNVHHESISSFVELEELFTYFFTYGAAAERYVHNSSLFDVLSSNADNLKDKQWTLGGNAPVMANRLYHEGADVLLGTSWSEKLLNLIPEGIKVVGPKLSHDDIHLILEYNKGEQWGKKVSPRANRFIIHNDKSNPQLTSMEIFSKELLKFKPSLLILGGLQMMDNFPFEPDQRQLKLSELEQMMLSVSPETKIHFEFASFANSDLLSEIINKVVIHSDSLGMNEQELPNLVTALNDGSVTLISDAYPRIATVLDQMRFVYNHLQNRTNNISKRKVTRLHVHTLAFQAILTDKSSTWKHSMSATAKAALTAHRHVCGSVDIDTLKARLIMDDSFSTSQVESGQRIPLQKDRPVSCWNEDDYEICVAPVLVCTQILKTVGGGDNISSAGLVLQI
ncbi:ADP-dependent glucokinase [Octopus sinensis]|uniref:ADP-dependent glucokinase n=1 Tax=Octopus sinensis TaxID=2607531 RepID=A0A6P7SAP9_9MOLL|nr:ADP-dependent glucokinase [Octopus sinensis]